MSQQKIVISDSKDGAKLARRLRKLGWVIDRTRKNHVKWIDPDGAIFIHSGTPSDFRSGRNFISTLRRSPHFPGNKAGEDIFYPCDDERSKHLVPEADPSGPAEAEADDASSVQEAETRRLEVVSRNDTVMSGPLAALGHDGIAKLSTRQGRLAIGIKADSSFAGYLDVTLERPGTLVAKYRPKVDRHGEALKIIYNDPKTKHGIKIFGSFSRFNHDGISLVPDLFSMEARYVCDGKSIVIEVPEEMIHGASPVEAKEEVAEEWDGEGLVELVFERDERQKEEEDPYAGYSWRPDMIWSGDEDEDSPAEGGQPQSLEDCDEATRDAVASLKAAVELANEAADAFAGNIDFVFEDGVLKAKVKLGSKER